MDYKYRLEVNNAIEYFDTGSVARQANGAVLMRQNDTVMLATIVYELDKPVNEDFLPLTVQYIEKTYAAGKVPGGFIKREAKPGDFETLTSRIIDRSLRPLFPKGYCYPTQITVLVMSADEKTDLQVMALNAASAALYMCDLPIKKSVCAVRVGRKDGEFLLNPSPSELDESSLDLFVAGSHQDLMMIEMRSLGSDLVEEVAPGIDYAMGVDAMSSATKIHHVNEMLEDEMIEALQMALGAIENTCGIYENTFKEAAKPAIEVVLQEQSAYPDIYAFIESHWTDRIMDAINQMAKSERNTALNMIAKEVLELPESKEKAWEYDAILEEVMRYKKKRVRQQILEEQKRADGRGFKDVRPISIETNILPSAHGSALFTRGETQALVVNTIGNDMDAQMYELLNDKGTRKEKFMVHYNFPGFSVGEACPIGPPARRELGHGNLAKRALEPVLVDSEAHTIRLVSEILESNGSSSMATVCGGSLALEATGVPTVGLVAGVAMGLVIEEGRHAILSDIMGLEDHDGDMDCKIAGTKNGITAMQMDIKLGGLDFEILKATLMQAKESREHILGIMEEAREKIEVNEGVMPSQNIFFINPGKIVDVIGQAGKTIKEIIERFEVAIDLDKKSGEVKITGKNKEKLHAASEHIKKIGSGEGGGGEQGGFNKGPSDMTELYQSEDTFTGKIRRTTDFGAFVELPKGGDGLIHISKLAPGRVEKVTDVVNVDDEVEVKILSVTRKKVELMLLDKIQ